MPAESNLPAASVPTWCPVAALSNASLTAFPTQSQWLLFYENERTVGSMPWLQSKVKRQTRHLQPQGATTPGEPDPKFIQGQKGVLAKSREVASQMLSHLTFPLYLKSQTGLGIKK